MAVVDELRDQGMVELSRAGSAPRAQDWLVRVVDHAASHGLDVAVIERGDVVVLIDMEH